MTQPTSGLQLLPRHFECSANIASKPADRTGRAHLATALAMLTYLGAVAGLTGCSTSSSAVSSGSGGGTAAKYVYSLGAAANNILQFSATASGTVTPTVTVPLPTGYSGQALATDSTGQIYVAAYNQAQSDVIFVYSANPTAAAQPSRTFTTVDGLADTIAVDSAGLVYVNGTTSSPNTNVIDVYAANATGAATPVRSIGGALTGIPSSYSNGQIAVGPTGTIYVINGNLLVFSSTANGNVAPQSTILANPGILFSNVAIGPNGNVAVVTTPDLLPMSPANYSIAEYSPSASGDAAPINSITGTLPAGTFPEVLAVDRAGNFYLSILTYSPAVGFTSTAITAFTSTASGSATPFVTFTSTAFDGQGDFAGVIAVY